MRPFFNGHLVSVGILLHSLHIYTRSIYIYIYDHRPCFIYFTCYCKWCDTTIPTALGKKCDSSILTISFLLLNCFCLSFFDAFVTTTHAAPQMMSHYDTINCDSSFGNGLVDAWRRTETECCKGKAGTTAAQSSSIQCHLIHQVGYGHDITLWWRWGGRGGILFSLNVVTCKWIHDADTCGPSRTGELDFRLCHNLYPL